MSKHPLEINDDEIRVISSSQIETKSNGKNSRRNKGLFTAIAAVAIVAIAAIAYFFITGEDEAEQVDYAPQEAVAPSAPTESDYQAESNGFVTITDTVVDGITFTLLTPTNLNPSLHIGADILSDPTVKMAFPATDIRRDNGEIVGAYVLEGNLISKGQSKAGFCAITNGKVYIGVADATPLLEQAIETNGYFFRQYPLVVGGQIVENKPQGRSQRKALVEINGEISVVVTEKRLTFHDFSQSLVDMGATNAIYLVGSTEYGFAQDNAGDRFEFGDSSGMKAENSNYIVWK